MNIFSSSNKKKPEEIEEKLHNWLPSLHTHTHTHGKPGKMQCKIHFTRIAVNFSRSAEALTTCLEIAAVLGLWPRFALKFLIASLKHLSPSLFLSLALSLSFLCWANLYPNINNNKLHIYFKASCLAGWRNNKFFGLRREKQFAFIENFASQQQFVLLNLSSLI